MTAAEPLGTDGVSFSDVKRVVTALAVGLFLSSATTAVWRSTSMLSWPGSTRATICSLWFTDVKLT